MSGGVGVSYFVLYEGEAEDRIAFVDYYRTRHVAILRRWPGIQAVHLHTPIPSPDPMPTQSKNAFLLAQLVFASEADLARALASPERAEARADMAHFPPFKAIVSHLPMASITPFDLRATEG